MRVWSWCGAYLLQGNEKRVFLARRCRDRSLLQMLRGPRKAQGVHRLWACMCAQGDLPACTLSKAWARRAWGAVRRRSSAEGLYCTQAKVGLTSEIRSPAHKDSRPHCPPDTATHFTRPYPLAQACCSWWSVRWGGVLMAGRWSAGVCTQEC